MRYLGLLKADKDSESGAPPSPEMLARMGPFIEEVMKTGVLLATDGLLPSSKGVRVRLDQGKFTVRDGPFTESKELVASYAVMQGTREEVIYWTRRFLEVLGGGECEIRQIAEQADFAGPCQS